jgi:hypothetical protein
VGGGDAVTCLMPSAVPDRELPGAQRIGVDGRPDVLFPCQPRNVRSRFVIRPVGEAAAVQTDPSAVPPQS